MKANSKQSGFSLIEVVITIGILMSLTIAVASMLRSGFEVKAGLSERARMLKRMSIAMTKIAEDVQHTFLVPLKDADRRGSTRTSKTVLKIEKNGEADKLSLTTRTHRVTVAGAKESDIVYVVYELKPSQTAAGRKNLYRGESKVPPEELREDPPMRLLARNIKSMTFEYWDGSTWSKDYWDTTRSDFRDLLPRLVRITLEAWKVDREDAEGTVDESMDADTDKIVSVVYLADSTQFQERRTGSSTIKWEAL